MANQVRAPKQWSLTKHETTTSFESWRQNLTYALSLDPHFATFMTTGLVWGKKTNAAPLRGFANETLHYSPECSIFGAYVCQFLPNNFKKHYREKLHVNHWHMAGDSPALRVPFMWLTPTGFRSSKTRA